MITTFLKWFFGVLIGLYACLHVVVASTPVQKRLFEEVRLALLKFGLDLQIESIQFSAFVPRFYLNRVTIGTTPQAPVQLPEPIQIDKIKVQFSPLGLLQKKIVIEEASLFHPKILVPHADELYKKFQKLLQDQSKIAVQGKTFNVEFKKIGIVDALFHVQSQNPPFFIRSRSLSAFLRQDSLDQQNISLNSTNLELERLGLQVSLSQCDVDVDISGKSLRVNRALLKGDDLNIQVKGATAFPQGGKKLPDSFHGSYEIELALQYLNKIPELKLPELKGRFNSTGNVKYLNASYSGNGSISYENFYLDGYKLGQSTGQYSFDGKKVELKGLKLGIAGGEMEGSSTVIKLEEPYAINGHFALKSIKLPGILETLKEEGAPVKMGINGTLTFQGQLVKPFGIQASLKSDVSDLLIVSDLTKPATGNNKVISVKSGKLISELKFTEDRMGFNGFLEMLDGKTSLEGFVGFDNKAEIKVKGNGISLTELHDIADLEFKGKVDLSADISVKGSNARINGEFETSKSELSNLVLGTVRGKAFYEDGLLSFEDLSRSAIEPVRAFGYVDFKPKDTHYRFDVNARRAGVDEIFSVFDHTHLDFPVPKGGETNAKIRIEGGHDSEGIEVSATGQSRNFQWYGEKWLSSTYSIKYRPKFVELSRAMLVKRSGGLEARGHFEGSKTELALISRGLRLEELNWIGKAPVQGEIVGSVRLTGNFQRPSGEGNVKVVNTFFRGNRLEDSSFTLRPNKTGSEINLSIIGERLRGRLTHTEKETKDDELILFFKSFDITPLLALYLEKDLPPVGNVLLTGDVSLRHVLENWHSVTGSGTLSDVNLGFRGNPMKNEKLVQFKFQSGALTLDRFRLVGPMGQVAVEYAVKSDGTVGGSLDGKLDLQHIQPFIPGLEYGLGRISMGLRVSGSTKKYNLLGNIQVEDGTFRLIGLEDEYRNANLLLTVSQDKINVDRFEALLGGGNVKVSGDVKIERFQSLIPNLYISASKVQLKANESLRLNLDGDFTIKGTESPYSFQGKCKLNHARLTDFNLKDRGTGGTGVPVFHFDIKCDAKDQLLVQTEVLDAEFKGHLRLMGNTQKLGLLGDAEAVKGSILFKDTKFRLETGNVKFEDPNSIAPRFNVTGRALVREQSVEVPQSYDVNLQVFGTPADYKIRLTSVPQLAEPELISLLILGVTSRSQEGNYVDFGTTIVGSTPFQTKLQDELGLDIKVSAQKSTATSGTGLSSTSTESTVPSVKVQKEVTKNTRVSVSNTIDAVPLKEFKIEHMLNDNFTVNGARTEKNKGLTQDPSAAYGVDFRYRFNFE